MEVTRLLGGPRHRSIADTDALLKISAEAWERWPAGPYSDPLARNERVARQYRLEFRTPYHAATGYVLARDAWSKGYATEALRAIVDLSPGLGVTQLSALCHPSHGASQRVLERRGSFRTSRACDKSSTRTSRRALAGAAVGTAGRVGDHRFTVAVHRPPHPRRSIGCLRAASLSATFWSRPTFSWTAAGR